MVVSAGKEPSRILTDRQERELRAAQRRERRLARESKRDRQAAQAGTSLQRGAARQRATASASVAASPSASASASASPRASASAGAASASAGSAPTSPAASGAAPASHNVGISAVRGAADALSDMVTAIVTAQSSVSRRASPGKRRRSQRETSDEEDDSNSNDEGSGEESDGDELNSTATNDPNIMKDGAAEAALLNSDDEPDSADESDALVSEDGEDFELEWGSDDEEPVVDESGMPTSAYMEAAKTHALLKKWRIDGWEGDESKFSADPRYEELYDGPHGPSESVLRVAENPLGLLFYFIPPALWRHIADESNRYLHQSVPVRAKALRKQQKCRNEPLEPLKDIRKRLHDIRPIEPWEILRVMGLLLARTLCPHQKGLHTHWAVSSQGAIPKGTFGDFLSRSRFKQVMMHLHFTNNRSASAKTDRAWKIRSVVDTLQRTFAHGYVAPPVISFDEMVLPSHSRRNPTRQYLPDKPHKWGTKLFAACCAESAYCMRIEVYVGNKQHLAIPAPADNATGPAAVLRNLRAVVPPSPTSPWRIVVTDRFYTSVQLALELMHRRMYIVGTIQTSRVGYADSVVTKAKRVQGTLEPSRGTTKMAQNRQFPAMTACMWMDGRPVHMLATGGSRAMTTVKRQVGGQRKEFSAPKLVVDYHRWMGGVDVHDQLRMQKYSIQLAARQRKYYRSLFLGLVDLALVNAFIVYKWHRRQGGFPQPRRPRFLSDLHEQLLALDAAAFEAWEKKLQNSSLGGKQTEDAATAAPTSILDEEHVLEENPDRKDSALGSKRRQRSCRVCAALRIKPHKFTKWFCPGCSNGDKRTYMCHVAREGHTKTCFQIWHEDWSNGTALPASFGQHHQFRARGPGTKGKRRRMSTSGRHDDEEDEDEGMDVGDVDA